MSVEQYINREYLKRQRADLHLRLGDQVEEGLAIVGRTIGDARRRMSGEARRLLNKPLSL